jgi:hypothetical protein
MVRQLMILLVLAACGGSPDRPVAPRPPPPPPPPAATAADAEAAYAAKDWARCASLYDALAEAAEPRRKELELYNAACCHALAGHADRAFARLDAAYASGTHGVAHLQADADLASLHADARWSKLITTVTARMAAWEASLGAPALRRELLALVERDQAARNAWIAKRDDPAAGDAVKAIDRETSARMKQIVAEHGWPGKKLIGEDGASAAWLLVQHADAEPAFQKQCLALIEPLIKTGDVEARHYAYLYDRVAVAEKRPQRWGTQFAGDAPAPIEDEAHVDERRKAIGLPTMAEYARMMRQTYNPPR